MEKIRSFIAIDLPDSIKTELETVESVLKAASAVSVKWVEPRNMHLTVKFLGNVNESQIAPVTSAIKQAALTTDTLRFTVQGLGVFPNIGRTQIAWAGLGGDIEELGKLHDAIDTELMKLGFKGDSGFNPHLTLARVRDNVIREDRLKFGMLVTETEFDAGSFVVGSVQLMKSTLTAQGPIYTELASIMLG